MVIKDSEEAVLRFVILRNMMGEYLEDRDNYLYRFRYPLPNTVPQEARRGVERIMGVDYTNDAVGVMRRLVEYMPFKMDYERYNEKYVAPEEFFVLIEKGYPVNINTYYIDFKHSEVLNEEKHTAGGEVVWREFLVDREGEKWKILLHRYKERPPWRGLAWQNKDIEGVAVHKLAVATNLYLKSKELFPKVLIAVKESRYTGKFRAKIYRYFEKNPVLDTYKEGYYVIYTFGRDTLHKEFLEMNNKDEVLKYVKKVAKVMEGSGKEELLKAISKVKMGEVKTEIEKKEASADKKLEKGGVEIG